MSLDVPTALLERAQQGEVDDTDFVDCVRMSLPYAWQVISGVVAALELAEQTSEFADHETPPPTQRVRAWAVATSAGLRRHPRRSGTPFRRDAGFPELPPRRGVPTIRNRRCPLPSVHLRARSVAQPKSRTAGLLTI